VLELILLGKLCICSMCALVVVFFLDIVHLGKFDVENVLFVSFLCICKPVDYILIHVLSTGA